MNARLLVYGASVAPRWAEQPRWFRAAGAALLIDPTWALADRHAGQAPSLAAQRRFFLAAGLTLGLGWSAMIAAGALAGDRLPSVGLDLASPLCLIAMVGPRLRDRRHRWAAIAAATTVTLAASWPAGTGVGAAIVVGAVAAHRAGRTSP